MAGLGAANYMTQSLFHLPRHPSIRLSSAQVSPWSPMMPLIRESTPAICDVIHFDITAFCLFTLIQVVKNIQWTMDGYQFFPR